MLVNRRQPSALGRIADGAATAPNAHAGIPWGRRRLRGARRLNSRGRRTGVEHVGSPLPRLLLVRAVVPDARCGR
eukprot:2983967-Alexandrium_andersonii.AAC.1